MALASVDLGGTNIAAAVGLADGSILREDQISTESHLGPEAVLNRIADLVESIAPEGVEALGLGVPGLCELSSGQTLFLPNMPTQWRGVPAAAHLRQRLNCPVFLLNDARMAALGELDYGHGKQTPNFAFFTLGTGIGGALVLDGHLRIAGGELGHQTILPDGPLCGCGSRGCLELLASASALTAEAVRLIKMGQAPDLAQRVEGDLNRVTPQLMGQCSDPSISAAIDRAARYLGIGIANVVTAFHPDLIVLGGGLAQMGAPLFDPVRDEVSRRVRMFPVDKLRIEPSLTGPRAGTLGGLALAHRRGVI